MSARDAVACAVADRYGALLRSAKGTTTDLCLLTREIDTDQGYVTGIDLGSITVGQETGEERWAYREELAARAIAEGWIVECYATCRARSCTMRSYLARRSVAS